MAQTNVQAFSGDVAISSNLEVGTANLFVDTVSGRVGVGTASPAGKLQIRAGRSSIYATDTASLISNAAINISSFADGTDYLSMGLLGATYDPDGNNPSAYMQVQWDTGGTPLTSSLLLNPIGGNVGIGTTFPTAKLEVYDDGLLANSGNLVADFAGSWIRVGDAKSSRTFTKGMGIKFHDANIAHYSIGQKDGIFRIAQTSSDGDTLFPGGGTDKEDALCVDTSGNVGIGTASPGVKLHLVGVGTDSGPKLRFETLNNGNPQYTVSGTEIGGIQFGADDLGWTTQHMSSEIVGIQDEPNYSGARGILAFKTSTTQGSNPTEKMRILANGNVGIGTTNPVSKLTVLANDSTMPGLYQPSYYTGASVMVSENNYNVEDARGGTEHYSTLIVSSDHASDSGNNAAGSIGFAAPNEFGGYSVQYGQISGVRLGNFYGGLSFSTMHNRNDGILREDMRIANGNVGIGTTSPGAKLDIHQSTATTTNSTLILENPYVFGFNTGQDIGNSIVSRGRWQGDGISGIVDMATIQMRKAENANYGDSYISFQTRYESERIVGGAGTLTERMRISPTGNVGIGTNNPEKAKLQVHNTIALVSGSYKNGADDDQLAGKIEFFLGGNSGELATPVAAIEGYDKWVGGSYFGAMAFKVHGTERMRLDQSGNVGIGTASPKQKFEVDSAGYGLFSGRLGVGNVLTSAQNGGGADIWNIGTSAKLLVRCDNSVDPAASYANARAYAGIALVPGFDAQDTTNMGLWGKNSGENPVFYIQNQVNNGVNGGGTIALQPVGGNVGIGVTSPLSVLTVKSNYSGGTASGFCLDAGDGTVYNLRLSSYVQAAGQVGYKFTVNNAASSVDALNFGYDGNVGIGMSNPLNILEVRGGDGTASDTYATFNSGGAGWSGIRLGLPYTSAHDAYCSVIESYNNPVNDYKTELRFKTSSGDNAEAGERMRITNQGLVGIGTATPYARLHAYGDVNENMSSSNRTYFRHSQSFITQDTGGWGGTCILAEGNILATSYIVSHGGTVGASDTRIKKNIVDADDAECLETLRLLKPKKYQYKDEVNRGTEPVWGFIAQEVRETLPYATQLRKDFLPNIYELANVSASNVITFTNFNTSNLESNATTLVRTKGIDGKDHDIHLAEVIDEHTIRVEEDLSNWIGSVDAEGNVVTEITTTTITPEEYDALEEKSGYVANISGYQNANVVVTVEEYNALEDTAGYEAIIDEYTKTTTTYPGTQLFIYGQEVDDFVFLKKDAIWTVATAALQEVDRQLQAEKAKVVTLETQLASVLARLDALESA